MISDTCIVVGNAPIRKDVSKKIDSFDTVIRVNQYRPEQSQYVGSKIDILSIGCPFWRLNYTVPDNIPIWAVFPKHAYYKMYKEGTAEGYTFINTDIEILCKIGLDVGCIGRYEFPTTGIVTIALAMMRFKKVYVYGFKLSCEEWEKGKFTVDTTKHVSHSLEKDRIYYNGLLKEKLIEEVV